MVNELNIGDSFSYTINGHQFNAYIESDNVENIPVICLVPISSAFGERILEIPTQINNIPVKRIDTFAKIIYCTGCIKFPKGIRFSSMVDLHCPIVEFVDLQDFYNNVNYIANFYYYTKLKINKDIIDHMIVRKNMILKTWQFKTLDFINIDDLSTIKLIACKIEKLVNTDKITILNSKFDIRSDINTPLRFPNLTIIESESISYGQTIITGDKLTFIEKNAVYGGFQYQLGPHIMSCIITESNPIMYEQDSCRPIKIIKYEKNILP